MITSGSVDSVGTGANGQSPGYSSASCLNQNCDALAAFKTWGPAHQFETLISATGPIKDGCGRFIITGSGDPFLVWEVIALGNSLNQLGIKRVTGNLVLTGNFAMNYKSNPSVGQLLKQGLDAQMWSCCCCPVLELPPPAKSGYFRFKWGHSQFLNKSCYCVTNLYLLAQIMK